MKIVISPAKSLNFKDKAPTNLHSKPQFLNKSAELNSKLKTLSRKQLSELMKISEELADLNYERNQNWHTNFTLNNAKQAIYAFTGEVYKGIDAVTISDAKIPVMQNKLLILSGLYGVLKPLDLIQPYRLEMGIKLQVGNKNNLYKFWEETIAEAINKEMEKGELLINLASVEYFKAVSKKILKPTVITPIFKELKGSTYKTIAIYAKKARGLMVRYIIDNDIKTITELKGFDIDGYGFSESLSTSTKLVFTR